MSVQNLFDRLENESRALPEVLAPVFARQALVGVVVNEHPYRMKVAVESPGWYILQPVSSAEARPRRAAMPYEILGALAPQPRLMVITVRRLSGQTWLVYPYNVSDARARGFATRPHPCHLVGVALEPFVTFGARLWGDALLFDASRMQPGSPEYKEALARGDHAPPKVAGLPPEYGVAYKIVQAELLRARQTSITGKIQGAVEYLGAELAGITEQGEGYEVEILDGEHRYSVRVDKSLRLLSAGICLSGRDGEQTLASSVAVMRQYFGGYSEDE